MQKPKIDFCDFHPGDLDLDIGDACEALKKLNKLTLEDEPHMGIDTRREIKIDILAGPPMLDCYEAPLRMSCSLEWLLNKYVTEEMAEVMMDWQSEGARKLKALLDKYSVKINEVLSEAEIIKKCPT